MSIKKNEKNGFSFTCYPGDGAVLLAFNLEQNKIDKLAGFAVKCKAPHAETYKTDEYWLKNRLNFEKPLTAKEKFTPEKWTPSNEAPFQAFHWTHFPNAGPGNYTYTAYPVYFDQADLKLAEGISIDVDLTYRTFPDFELGFTRGYLSSQAYADKFGNAPIQPKQKSMDFPTDDYLKQYVWLGSHARDILFKLLEESSKDNSIYLDVFAFDFNEPDVIRKLCEMGPRVRVFMDDSSTHVGDSALEPKTKDKLIASGAKVETGKFGRFAHDKVIIQKNKSGNPIKVLTGSANFSVRGLYVQANSILLFDDSEIAKLYETAFEQAFSDSKGFKKSDIASRWFGAKIGSGSPVSISYAPHVTAFSLDRVAEVMESARSSVMFALMEVGGGGSVMNILQNLGARENLYAMGTIEKKGELDLFKPGKEGQLPVTSFAFLNKDAPKPFKNEISGGPGQVIHHKFIVCDFNDKSPMVFCGSSNLSEGGEKANGDNLIAIQDNEVAACYAVEAIRLYDCYRFRSQHEASTSENPLKLSADESWTARYYNPKDIKFRERELFAP